MTPRKSQKELMGIFFKAGAILKGHFVLRHDEHSDTYVNKDAVYPYPQIHDLCKELVMMLPFYVADNCQAVVAPALGGIVLSRLIADYLWQCHETEALAIYAEKTADGKKFEFTRGYDKLIAGNRVLIVDDIMTKGGSVANVKAAAEKCGAQVIGAAVFWNRGGITEDMIRVPSLTSLINHQFPSWTEEECPLCKQDMPVNQEVGKGRKFLTQKAMEDVTKAANKAVAEVLGEKKK